MSLFSAKIMMFNVPYLMIHDSRHKYLSDPEKEKVYLFLWTSKHILLGLAMRKLNIFLSISFLM